MPALLETILYTPHPLRCAAFYQSLFGLRPVGTPDEHMAAAFQNPPPATRFGRCTETCTDAKGHE